MRGLTTDNLTIHIIITRPSFLNYHYFFYFYGLSFNDLELEKSVGLILRSLLLHHSLPTNSHEVAYKIHNVP